MIGDVERLVNGIAAVKDEMIGYAQTSRSQIGALQTSGILLTLCYPNPNPHVDRLPV